MEMGYAARERATYCNLVKATESGDVKVIDSKHSSQSLDVEYKYKQLNLLYSAIQS